MTRCTVRALPVVIAAVVLALAIPGHAAAKEGGPPLETFRISGGDLPHPVVVSLTEYLMTVNGAGSWYASSDLPAPASASAAYRVEVIDAEAAGPPVAVERYLPGPPARLTTDNGTTWAAPVPAVSDLLNRYILLTRAGRLGERPTLGESLAASGRALGVSVSADGAPLASDAAVRLTGLLERSQAVVFGVRGRLIGSRNLHQVQVTFAFGGSALRLTYVPPGPIAPYGLLFSPASVGSWELVTLLSPPGYVQTAYTVPAEFDREMAALGFRGASEGPIVENRLVPVTQAASAPPGIDRYEVWFGDGPRVRIAAAPGAAVAAPCAPGASCAAAVPPAGPSLTVEVWPHGIDPFPEAVRPARYTYYPHDASGAQPGVLVMTQQMAYANVGGGLEPPVRAAPALDAMLRAQLAQLSGASSPSHRLRVVVVGVPAVLLGVVAIAYVSWDAERRRRRSDPE